ncbi:MAG: 4-hydroxy-tetrahydrodipicolinate reductase [Candidatus Amoebophilus sp.]
MKIALIGYGKMGKAIEQIALQRKHHITYRIDYQSESLIKQLTPETVDLAIEFSQPEAAYNNIYTCLQQGIPVISGTTGWLTHQPAIEQYCQETQGTFFYAANFSLAVQILFKLNALLAKYMNYLPGYTVSIEEIHHITKKDQPSGTSIQLAEDIIKNSATKTKWINTAMQEPDAVSIISQRISESPGTHIINYSSNLESLELKHTAHSRESFAQGVVLVAEWIQGKKGMLGMDDFLNLES